ncbi:MAG: hypothetical protein ABIG61_10180 [Planctomycetota bacterium]
MSDWQINKPLGRCFGTGRDIGPDEEYYAALVETAEGFERRDFSPEYWQQAEPQVYCFWKSRLPHPGKKRKQMFIDDEMLVTFFERLAKETDDEKIKFRFVLALVLMRKRIIKYDSSRLENGREIWHVRFVREKELIDVVNPNLNEEQIEQLSSQIGEILQVDL